QEVLFVHKYSGNLALSSSIVISASYTLFAYTTYWFTDKVPLSGYSDIQCLCGVILFVFGEGLNFAHHRILSNLRLLGSNHYQIPQGGLFKYVWCPHYLGEIISFIAFALISQHIFIGVLQVISAIYLCIRAYNTRIWYEKR
ncbi:3-oxo-5-alpha-steroid 4-dehydrogenase-domain-containing protein, partial [Umbelopsis sp. PMI_123]